MACPVCGKLLSGCLRWSSDPNSRDYRAAMELAFQERKMICIAVPSLEALTFPSAPTLRQRGGLTFLHEPRASSSERETFFSLISVVCIIFIFPNSCCENNSHVKHGFSNYNPSPFSTSCSPMIIANEEENFPAKERVESCLLITLNNECLSQT